MNVNAKTLVLTEQYLADFEPEKFPEQVFAEFGKIEKLNKQFLRYCKKNKLKRDLSSIKRREIFINWYVNKHQNKSLHECVKDLSRILFVSMTTIYSDINGYRN